MRGVAVSATVLSFTWLPPPPVDINGILLYYEADITEIETGQTWTFYVLGDDLRLGSLRSHFTYQCEVAAHTVGRGPFSDPFQIMTLETCKKFQHSHSRRIKLLHYKYSIVEYILSAQGLNIRTPLSTGWALDMYSD